MPSTIIGAASETSVNRQRPRTDHVDHHSRIEPGALRQDHRLGGARCGWLQMVGDDFIRLPLPNRRDRALLGEVGK